MSVPDIVRYVKPNNEDTSLEESDFSFCRLDTLN